jgi:hypothetical protein
MAWQYSDIPGIGHHVGWIYHGPTLQAAGFEYWGTCPDVAPRSGIGILKDGVNTANEGGFLLPEKSGPGDRIQFIDKIVMPQGTYGGSISFTLRQGTKGFEPSDVTIVPLSQMRSNC